MTTNHLLNQFLGIDNNAAAAAAGSTGAKPLVKVLPARGVAGGVATGGILSLLLGHKSSGKMPTHIAEYPGASAFGVLGYKAYDSWKHHSNEDTQIASETQFHQHGLDTSRIQPEEFELAIVKVMIAAAKSAGHIDAEQKHKILVVVDSMAIDTEVKSLIFEHLLRDISLHEIDTTEFSLPLKTEIYLAALVISGELSERETRFLRQLAEHLALPPGLVHQIQLQASLKQLRAA